jgi:hypothetical protein
MARASYQRRLQPAQASKISLQDELTDIYEEPIF